jgi:predicted transcriptional regulator
MSKVTIHFAADRQKADHDSLARLLEADARYNRGEEVEAEDHVTFESFEMLLSALSPKRLELLRHLHQHPARSTKALAKAVDRDYRRVHDDVAALAQIGLIERDGTALRAPHDEIAFALSLSAPAKAA